MLEMIAKYEERLKHGSVMKLFLKRCQRLTFLSHSLGNEGKSTKNVRVEFLNWKQCLIRQSNRL